MQKLLKTPAGFKNHTLVDQQKSSRHSTQANISTHPELLAVDLLSSEEEEDEEVWRMKVFVSVPYLLALYPSLLLMLNVMQMKKRVYPEVLTQV